MIDLATSILAIKEDAQVTINDDDINTIIWHDGNPTNITNEEIFNKQKELQAEEDAQEYARKREAECPSIQECVHAILDDNLTALQKKRQTVKTKYPKS